MYELLANKYNSILPNMIYIILDRKSFLLILKAQLMPKK